MKQTILAVLLSLPLLAAAQEVTFDTTYLSVVDSQYYVIQRVEFDNGEYEEKSRVLGDSTTTAQFLLTTAANEQQVLSQAAVAIIKGGQVRQRYNQVAGLFLNLTGGKLLFQAAADQFYDSYEGKWAIRYAGELKTVDTQKLPNSNTRFVDDQNAVWFFRILSPRNIILVNWDGKNWDLWSEDGVVFYDLERTLILRKLPQ